MDSQTTTNPVLARAVRAVAATALAIALCAGCWASGARAAGAPAAPRMSMAVARKSMRLAIARETGRAPYHLMSHCDWQAPNEALCAAGWTTTRDQRHATRFYEGIFAFVEMSPEDVRFVFEGTSAPLRCLHGFGGAKAKRGCATSRRHVRFPA